MDTLAKVDKDTELARLTGALKRSFAQWDHLYNYGGQDPFWPDGTNLNLVRNHILSEKKGIERLVSEESEELSLFGLSYPDIYYRETPQMVDGHYMARAEEIRTRAREQLALYEKDPNFLYCLEAHKKVFPKGETKATRAAGLSYGASAALSRYRSVIEQDDLVSMRRDFYESYESKAPRWAETAQKLKTFLEMEHDPKDNVPAESDFLDEDDSFDEDFDLEEEEPEKPVRKASLDDRIYSAKKKAEEQKESAVYKEEHLSLF